MSQDERDPGELGTGDHVTFANQLDRGVDHLVRLGHVAAPDELPIHVADAAATFGADDAGIFLVDLQQRVLLRFDGVGHTEQDGSQPLGVDSTVAGRAFQQMQRLTQSAAPRDGVDRTQVWLPLLDGTERLGVLGITLPSALTADQECMQRVQRFAGVVAELVVSKTQYGDSLVRARRTGEMTLAAEIQWSLLPPLTFVNHSVTVTGGLEPAYEVAGDSLDYAVDSGVARFAVFDGMGHGIVSAQLISLVVAAYRNGRRARRSLTETAVHIEAAVNDVFRMESFATALLCELDTTTGIFTWISAGHHAPLLLRDGNLVRPLEVEPLLPLGLNHSLSPDTSASVGSEQLEPGDMLLLYTDGVTEARSPDGEFFGQDRLVDMVRRNLASGLPSPETMRRVVHALLDHQSADLKDDATLLLVEWHGSGAPLDAPPPSLAGQRALDPPHPSADS